MLRVEKVKVRCKINGKPREFQAYPMSRLLDVIREDARLTGTKEGCGEGECGACSVIMNGELVNSCIVPIAQAEGAEIRTVESLSDGARLHPVQESFVKHGAAQCGICTPGMLMAAVHLLEKVSSPNTAQIRDGLSGNLCRCTGYTRIFEAVEKAGGKS